MASSSIIKLIKEGQAQLQITNLVFYNNVQEFNRDLSVLVLRTYLKHNLWHYKNQDKHIAARGGLKILDALSASGLRSIRYAKELGESRKLVKSIVANDLSESAVDQIRKNIELNKVEDIVTPSHSDASELIYSSSKRHDERFHVIDLDPFGTGAQFFDAALRGIGDAGLLMVTCTDTAVLCGNASESCFARYGSMSVKAEFCHENALRIILRSLEQHANVYGRYIKPLLSLSVDFYVRLFVQVFTQPAATKLSASKLCQVYLCKECKTHELQPLGTHEIKAEESQANSQNLAVKYKFKPADVIVGDRCKICLGRYSLSGPIWSEAIHDKGFLDLIKKELALEETQKEFATFRRIQGMMYLCSEEVDVPLFHNPMGMSSALRMKVPSSKDLMSALVNAGYKASLTHTNHQGLKTNAPNRVVWDIFCQIAEKAQRAKPPNFPSNTEATLQDKPDKKFASDCLMERIMSRRSEKLYDFTYNPSIGTESQKLSMLRFQVPPEHWGPKPMPQKNSKPL